MRDTRVASYRLFLLASVASIALSGGAGAANYNNSSPATNSGPSYSLHAGDTLSNSSSITATGGGQPGVQANSGVTSITNSGLIQGTGASGLGIQVVSGGSVGSITNSGTVQATNGGAAILVGDTVGPGASVGTLINTGTITASGAGNAVQVDAGGTISAIINSATIAALGSGNAIDVAATGVIGSITNSGVLTGGDGAIANAGTIGSIANSGVMSGTNSAIYNSGTVGGITNSATISGPNAAIANAGTIGSIANLGVMTATNAAIGNNGAIGSITNSATISGYSGAIFNVGTIGSVANSGILSGTGTNVYNGSAIDNSGTIGSIANTGTIFNNSGTFYGGNGAAIANGGTIGSIVNSGSILAPSGTAIAMGSGGTIISGITNQAGGLIQGGPGNGSGTAIDDSAGIGKLAITTAGTVIGAIKLGPAGDTLNVTGGAIVGNIIGQSGSGDVVNFNPTGTFTTGGSIANIDTINVNTNALVVNNPVSAAMAFDVASGATANLNAAVGANSFRNAGMVNVGSGTQTITGNYTQASSGSLGITLTNDGAGHLNVSGTATLQGGSDTVTVTAGQSFDPLSAIGKTYDVLTAASLVANGSLTAVSTMDVSFDLTDSSTDLYLTGLTPSAAQASLIAIQQLTAIFGPLEAAGMLNGADLQMLRFLANLEGQLASSGPAGAALAVRINSELTFILDDGPSQLVQVLRVLAPSSLSTSALALATAGDSLNGGMSTINDRLTSMRLNPTQSGLAAGDAVGRGIAVWGQPFGGFLNQNAKDGFDGYSVGGYGITMGGDMLLTPELRVGAAVTLSNSNVWFNGFSSGANGTIFTSQFSLYGEWSRQNFFVDGVLAFAYSQYHRHDPIYGFDVVLDSDSGGTELSAKLGGGYDWHVGQAVITPYVSIQQMHFNFGGYTTSGGSAFDFDQSVSSQSIDITQTRVGARAAYPVKLPNGITVTPEFHAYYLHDFGQDQLNTTFVASDVPGATPFVVPGAPLDRDILNLGISAAFAHGPGWTLTGGYDYLGRASSTAHVFYVNVKIPF